MQSYVPSATSNHEIFNNFWLTTVTRQTTFNLAAANVTSFGKSFLTSSWWRLIASSDGVRGIRSAGYRCLFELCPTLHRSSSSSPRRQVVGLSARWRRRGREGTQRLIESPANSDDLYSGHRLALESIIPDPTKASFATDSATRCPARPFVRPSGGKRAW